MTNTVFRKMVVLTIKHGTDLQFLYECSNKTPIRELKEDLRCHTSVFSIFILFRKIYNGRLKIERIATEMEQLADHGTILPENMQGLNESQVSDLKLVDPFTSKCIPSGGFEMKKDIYGRRNGQAPMENMAKVLKETAQKAKDLVSKKRVDEKFNMTYETVDEALQIMKGAVMIVYPMDLPPYDPVRAELENKEDLSGQQASKLVIPEHSIGKFLPDFSNFQGSLSNLVGKQGASRRETSLRLLREERPNKARRQNPKIGTIGSRSRTRCYRRATKGNDDACVQKTGRVKKARRK
jgi:hypothetical protein